MENKEFLHYYELLEKVPREQLDDPYLPYAVVQLFQGLFTAALAEFRRALRQEQPLMAMGSSREIIAAAYETWLFVDESLWLEMLAVKQNQPEDVPALARRILAVYLPAFTKMKEEL